MPTMQRITDEKFPGTQRATDAMLRMKKIDVAELRWAYEGTP